MGWIALFSFQTVHAQDYFDEGQVIVDAYDDDVAYFDKLTWFYLSEEYAFFDIENYLYFEKGVEDEASASAQAIAANSSCGPPRNLDAYHSDTNRITAIWSSPNYGTATGYYVYMDGSLVYTTTTPSLSCDFYASPGTHTIYVRAYDNYGESQNSNTKSVTVKAQSPAPTLNSVVQSGSGQVTLSWSYVSSATTYCIYRQHAGSWTKVWDGFGTFTGTGATITGVQQTISCPAGIYYFAVSSQNPGESGKSNTKLITVQ
jgi:hypothetical protein